MQNDIYTRFVKSSQYTEMVKNASDFSSQGRRWALFDWHRGNLEGEEGGGEEGGGKREGREKVGGWRRERGRKECIEHNQNMSEFYTFVHVLCCNTPSIMKLL